MDQLTPEQIDDLQVENAELKNDNASLKANVEKLSAENEELIEKNIELEALNDKLTVLVGNPSAKPAASTDLPTLEHEGKTYQWKRKSFKLAGSPEVFTIDQAEKDSALVERLLSFKGQEVLVEVEN